MKKFLAVLLLACACTDAETSSYSSFNHRHIIVCYSGGKEVFRTESSGVVHGSQGGLLMWADGVTGDNVGTSLGCIATVKR